MSDDTLKIKRKLSALMSSLDDLETGLSTLLSQSLPEVILGLDTIQQAKLQVVIPYLVYDLVFVYLKTRGVDPKTHPLITELDRVRQYFDKIKDAEDPAKRQLTVDRAAATRFIKHAISQAKDIPSTNDSVPVPGPSTRTRTGDNDDDEAGTASAIRVPVTMTEKMLEREQYHAALQREDALASEEESGDLEVIDGEELDGSLSDDTSPHQASRGSGLEVNNKTKSKGKGKAKAVGLIPTSWKAHDVPSSETTTTGKRRRPAIDPFAGYGDDPDTRSPPVDSETGSASDVLPSGSKARRIRMETANVEASSGNNTPSGGEQRDGVRNLRKRSKKKGRP